MRIQILILAFLTSCSGGINFQNTKNLLFSSLFFFKTAGDCEKAYKKISKKTGFSKKEKEKFAKQLNHCLKENKTKKAGFILERLLKESQRQRDSVNEIKKWEKKLAELSFYKIKNYEKALKHYSHLLVGPLEPGEEFLIQYHIAESFFYLRKYSQALREGEKCFFDGISMEQRKQALILKGRIFIAQRHFEPAILLFEEQIGKFPEEEAFFREYLAFIYESKKDFSSAIKELKKIDSPNPFLQQKINRLTDRQNNQPGF